MSWFTDTTRCYNGGAQHRFEGRYSQKSQPFPGAKFNLPLHVGDDVVTAALQASQTRTTIYHNDVCIWCGKVTNMQAPTIQAAGPEKP